MAKDYLKNEINVGDSVVFIENEYRYFRKGIITKIGKAMVTIEYGNQEVTHKYFSVVIKFNPDKNNE